MVAAVVQSREDRPGLLATHHGLQWRAIGRVGHASSQTPLRLFQEVHQSRSIVIPLVLDAFVSDLHGEVQATRHPIGEVVGIAVALIHVRSLHGVVAIPIGARETGIALRKFHRDRLVRAWIRRVVPPPGDVLTHRVKTERRCKPMLQLLVSHGPYLWLGIGTGLGGVVRIAAPDAAVVLIAVDSVEVHLVRILAREDGPTIRVDQGYDVDAGGVQDVRGLWVHSIAFDQVTGQQEWNLDAHQFVAMVSAKDPHLAGIVGHGADHDAVQGCVIHRPSEFEARCNVRMGIGQPVKPFPNARMVVPYLVTPARGRRQGRIAIEGNDRDACFTQQTGTFGIEPHHDPVVGASTRGNPQKSQPLKVRLGPRPNQIQRPLCLGCRRGHSRQDHDSDESCAHCPPHPQQTPKASVQILAFSGTHGECLRRGRRH